MDVVADLLSLVAEHGVRIPGDRASGEISEKAVQFGPGVARSRQTAAAKAGGEHPKIAPILLHKDIGGELRSAKKAMETQIDAHAFVDPMRRKRMFRADFPALLLLYERQGVGRIAVDFVGAGEDKRRLRAVPPRRFQQIQGSIGIDCEIRLRMPAAQSCEGWAAV